MQLRYNSSISDKVVLHKLQLSLRKLLLLKSLLWILKIRSLQEVLVSLWNSVTSSLTIDVATRVFLTTAFFSNKLSSPNNWLVHSSAYII